MLSGMWVYRHPIPGDMWKQNIKALESSTTTQRHKEACCVGELMISVSVSLVSSLQRVYSPAKVEYIQHLDHAIHFIVRHI